MIKILVRRKAAMRRSRKVFLSLTLVIPKQPLEERQSGKPPLPHSGPTQKFDLCNNATLLAKFPTLQVVWV